MTARDDSMTRLQGAPYTVIEMKVSQMWETENRKIFRVQSMHKTSWAQTKDRRSHTGGEDHLEDFKTKQNRPHFRMNTEF